MNSQLPSELHPWPPLLAFVLDLDSTEVVSLIDRTGTDMAIWLIRAGSHGEYEQK